MKIISNEQITEAVGLIATHGRFAAEPLRRFLENLPPTPDRTRMTYYKNDKCEAESADAPDCICWTSIEKPEQETITIQEAWVVAGGNPNFKATKEELIENLKLLNEICDDAEQSIIQRTSFKSLNSNGVLDEWYFKTIDLLSKRIKELEKNDERLQWLLDRLQIRYERPMSGGEPRALLDVRLGFDFLDSKMKPEAGWTSIENFHKCREKVVSAIDAAIKAKK